MHHPDYLAPFDVVWLCKKHHNQADKELCRRHTRDWVDPGFIPIFERRKALADEAGIPLDQLNGWLSRMRLQGRPRQQKSPRSPRGRVFKDFDTIIAEILAIVGINRRERTLEVDGPK